MDHYECQYCGNTVLAMYVEKAAYWRGTSAAVRIERPVRVLCACGDYEMKRVSAKEQDVAAAPPSDPSDVAPSL